MKKYLFIIGALVCIALMVSCHSVPPSVIGTETRAGLETLTGQVSEIASQAGAIDSGVETVAKDLERLATAAPAALRPEIRAIQDKVANLGWLTEAHEKATVTAAKLAGEVKKTSEDDMQKTAVLADEKAKAETREAKTTGQRNTAWVILVTIGLAGAIILWIKLKPRFLP